MQLKHPIRHHTSLSILYILSFMNWISVLFVNNEMGSAYPNRPPIFSNNQIMRTILLTAATVSDICVQYYDIMLGNISQQEARTWWRHDMDILSVLLALCEGNPPVTRGCTEEMTVVFCCGISKCVYIFLFVESYDWPTAREVNLVHMGKFIT